MRATLKDKINRILGNNVRLLLPSYWWKRVFGLIADEVDNVEKLANSSHTRVDNLEKRVTSHDTRIEETISLVEENVIPLVESKEALESLASPLGTIARVTRKVGSQTVKVADCYLASDPDNYASEWDKLTVIKKIEETDANVGAANILYICALNESFAKDAISVGYEHGARFYQRIVDGVESLVSLDTANDILATGNYRLAICPVKSGFDSYFTFYTEVAKDVSDAYIKGETWARLLKEGDVTGGGDDNVVTFYAPIDDSGLSDTGKQHNAESYQKVAEGFETDKYYDVKVLMSTTQLVTFDAIQILNPAIDEGKLKLLFQWVSDGREQMVLVTSDGSATIEDVGTSTIDTEMSDISTNAVQNKVIKAYIDEKVANVGGSEIRELYVGDSLTEEQKAWNLETKQLVEQNKCITVHVLTEPIDILPVGTIIPQSLYKDSLFFYMATAGNNRIIVNIGIDSNGNGLIAKEVGGPDSELSDTSANVVQNKAVKAYIDNAIINTLNTEI